MRVNPEKNSKFYFRFYLKLTARSHKLYSTIIHTLVIADAHVFGTTFAGPYECQLFGVIFYPDAQSVAECQAACNTVSTCSGIAYVPSEGPCYFYGTSATLVPDTNTDDTCLEYIRAH